MIPKYLIIHHTGGSDLDPRQDSSGYTLLQCDIDHRAKFNFPSKLGWYVGYQYFIDKNGKVSQCRLDNEEGAHTIGQNTNSIGICLAGNFDVTLPTEAQVKSLTKLLKDKTQQWNIFPSNIVPHRKFASKTCYGTKLSDSWARDLLLTPQRPTNIADLYAQITALIALLKAKYRL